MTSLELAGYLKGGNVSAVEVADAIDAYLDARLEQAMPKIMAAIRGGNNVPDKCDCGHDKTTHICYAGGCRAAWCRCQRFLSEQPVSK